MYFHTGDGEYKEHDNMNIATAPLQRALEIYESLLDPDSPEVGSAMYQLAILYITKI